MTPPRKTIYIIDDDIDDVEIFTELIARIRPEFVCLNCKNQAAALGAIKAVIPKYIFLSLSLPKLNGDKLLQELRQVRELSDTYIVVQTISLTADVERMLLSHGANKAIEKPYNMDEYFNILKGILVE